MKKQVFTLFLVLISLMSSAQEFTNYYSGYLMNHSVITDDSLVYAGCNKAINIYYKDRTFKEIKPVNGYVYSSTKDALGKLYFAVSALNESEDAGIITYDGEAWDFIPVTTGYTTQELLTTTFDLDNNLWVGINPLNYSSISIIAKYNGTDWINYSTIGDSIIISDPSDIVCDTNNIIYAGTDYGVIAISATDTSIYTHSNSELSIGCIHGSYVDMDNNIWFGGHFFKPNYFDGEEWHLDSLAPGDGYYSIFQDTAGYMWFGANGLHVQNDTGYVSYTDGNIIEFNGISNIIHDSQNNIWIATQDYQDVRQGCLVKYDEDGFHNCFPNTHLGKPKLISFLNNKIYTYNNSPLSVFDYINWNIDITGTELFKTTTNSVCIDNLENTWIGTNDGLYKINSNESIEHIAELFGNEVSKVKCVGSFNNNVWVITSDNKFYKFDGAIWSEIEIPIGYSLNTATRIFVRNENEIWFTRSSRSAIKYNQNAWQIYDTTAGFLPNQNINDICFAGDSTWFATIYGAVLLYNDELSFHCNDSSFFSGYSYLQTVQVDKNGLVWFGNRKGAMAYNGETISYLQPTGSEAEIYSIREDPERNLWFCGENAVSKYTFDNSGVENSKAEQKFCKLFPNPASNLVNLELPVGVKQDVVQIFSTSGVMLISKTITDQTTQIDVSALKPGLYLLKFKNARIYGKLIIE